MHVVPIEIDQSMNRLLLKRSWTAIGRPSAVEGQKMESNLAPQRPWVVV